MSNRLAFVCLTFSIVSAGSVLSAASTAHAQAVYAGVMGGYAAASGERERGVEPFGVGVGASAGLSLPVVPIYVGARILWHFGDSAAFSEDGVELKLRRHYLLYGLDLGYDAELGPIVLRPALGVGRATLEDTTKGLGVDLSGSDSSLYLAPSIGLLLKLGLLYAGAEARFNWLTESDHYDSVSLLASLGVWI
jgi:hypothetical protein